MSMRMSKEQLARVKRKARRAWTSMELETLREFYRSPASVIIFI